MICTLERLYADVSARLGEIPRPQGSPSSTKIPSPSEIIACKADDFLPEVGARVIKEASPELLTSAPSYDSEISMRIMPCGLYAAEMPLPASFLRLASVRMSGWSRSVRGLILPGSPEWDCQWSPETGIAGSPSRPKAYLDMSGGSPIIRAMASSSADDTPAELSCFCAPIPSADAVFIFPDTLYYALVAEIAAAM